MRKYMVYLKCKKVKPTAIKKEDTPMQNIEDVAHFSAYRYENDKIARILCMAVGG